VVTQTRFCNNLTWTQTTHYNISSNLFQQFVKCTFCKFTLFTPTSIDALGHCLARPMLRTPLGRRCTKVLLNTLSTVKIL